MKTIITALCAATIALGTTGAAMADGRDCRDHRDRDRDVKVVYVAPVRHDRDCDRREGCKPLIDLHIKL